MCVLSRSHVHTKTCTHVRIAQDVCYMKTCVEVQTCLYLSGAYVCISNKVTTIHLFMSSQENCCILENFVIKSMYAAVVVVSQWDIFGQSMNIFDQSLNISMVTCPTCLTNISKIFQESDLKICPTLVSGTYAMCVFALLVK